MGCMYKLMVQDFPSRTISYYSKLNFCRIVRNEKRSWFSFFFFLFFIFYFFPLWKWDIFKVANTSGVGSVFRTFLPSNRQNQENRLPHSHKFSCSCIVHYRQARTKNGKVLFCSTVLTFQGLYCIHKIFLWKRLRIYELERI